MKYLLAIGRIILRRQAVNCSSVANFSVSRWPKNPKKGFGSEITCSGYDAWLRSIGKCFRRSATGEEP